MQKTVEKLIDELWRPKKVLIIGVTGQAGAGKTHLSRVVLKQTLNEGIDTEILSLDKFFKLSSTERKIWLTEPGISEEERKRREDQINWWDFELLEASLKQLLANHHLHLQNVYDRSNNGELTGEVTIDLRDKGGIVILEGVAILHVPHIEKRLYIHTSPTIRFARLQERDRERRSSPEEVRKRWELTQRFEQKYFREYWTRIDMFFNNDVDPHPLESLTPEEALKPHPELGI